jgi:PAS domain S-box-containing protein
MMSPYYLALLFAVPAAISMTVGILSWRRRTSEVDALLALLMFSTVFWSLGYSFELASARPFLFWVWGVVQYIGIASASTFFFLLMLHYAGLEAWLTRRAMAALWAFPAVTVLLRVTTPLHGLIHSSTEIRRNGSFAFQIHDPGPWFWLVIAYSYLMLFGGVMILMYFRSYARVIHRRHMTVLALGSLAPLAGSLAYITGLRPLGYVDLTPMGFTFSALAVAWGALGHRVLEIMPVARTALVDGFPDGLLMMDRRGRILDMNVAAGRMLRLDVTASLGKDAATVLAAWPALVRLCRAEIEDTVEFEDRASGGYLEGRLTFLRHRLGQVSASLIVVTDITDRKRAEEMLSKSEALYHDLVETAQDLIWQCDAEGKYTYLNPAWEHVLGIPIAEMLGKSASDFQSLEAAQRDAREFDRLMQDGMLKGYETVLLGGNGREVRLIFNAKHVRDENGNVIGTRGTAHDITDRKRVEEQLRQAMKMEAVGRLAGGVAHDFNNLLQAINGNTEMALREIQPDHSAHVPLVEIAQAGERASKLVRRLLAFGRRQVIRPEHLNLNEVVTALLSMLGRVIGEHIRIDFVSGLLLGTIYADRGQIEQVLMNLAVNARDAMPEGGALTIETANVLIDEDYCHTHPWAKPGGYVMLSVADGGLGMDVATLERIWEPFFTTKEVGKGTGLGLPTVYGIVKQHDGMIDVISQPGEGATFKVYFPRVEKPAAAKQAAVERPLPGGHETILLAEDEEMVRNLARRILEVAGYTVLTAENGEDALRVAEQHDGEVSLALLDVVMPVLGGRAAYERLKDLYPNMRFLFASGYNAATVNDSFVLDEGLELIQKPFKRRLLLEKVRESLDRE